MSAVELRRLYRRSKVLGYINEPMLSVYRERGVVLKDEVTNHNKTAEDRSIYQLVDDGWLVVNRMKAWQGSLGVSTLRGIVSGHYICFEPTHAESHRYLHYALRAPSMTAYFASISRGVRPGQMEINNDDLTATRITLPRFDEQERIANFLDDRVARIDRIIAARRAQIGGLDAERVASSYSAVKGAAVEGKRRESGLRWLGDIPADWPVLTVQTQFSVELGKMLDEQRQTRTHTIPYLRNTNVQWDRIDLGDLKSMDITPVERSRYTVQPGDLLICEGGQPGRAAIWDGTINVLGFQKALHRARTRGRSRAAWLLECLRVAVHMNAFAAENGITTIGHLTNEQLRGQRLPFPEPEVQDRLLERIAQETQARSSGRDLLTRSVDLLTEYKSSLITAAVAGELDVTTAGSGVPA
jgi:type I restriction enzyme S subunit